VKLKLAFAHICNEVECQICSRDDRVLVEWSQEIELVWDWAVRKRVEEELKEFRMVRVHSGGYE
jgi:hypothetical protein